MQTLVYEWFVIVDEEVRSDSVHANCVCKVAVTSKEGVLGVRY